MGKVGVPWVIYWLSLGVEHGTKLGDVPCWDFTLLVVMGCWLTGARPDSVITGVPVHGGVRRRRNASWSGGWLVQHTTDHFTNICIFYGRFWFIESGSNIWWKTVGLNHPLKFKYKLENNWQVSLYFLAVPNIHIQAGWISLLLFSHPELNCIFVLGILWDLKNILNIFS